jgi:outer membrane protein assembly factor BamD (BamD/ComL family)
MKKHTCSKSKRKAEGMLAMQTRILLSVGCLAFSVLLTSCDNPEKAFKRAEQANTETGYTYFIKQHPESPLVAQAQSDLEKVVYEAAKRAVTSEAFEKFLSRFPKSPLAKQAQVDLENAEYSRTTQAKTATAYEAFLVRFPDGAHVAKAKAELEDLEYDKAKQTGTVAAYEAFLTRFPAGEHFSTAKAELENTEFAAAGERPSIAAWQAFLKKYPNSLRSSQATSNLCFLSFNAASTQNTVAALETFLKDFPESQFGPDALAKLAPLVWKDVSATNSVSAYESFFARFHNTSAAQQAASVIVRKALYGDLESGRTLDVTDKVRAIVLGGNLSIEATDFKFGRLNIHRAIMKARHLNFGGEGGGRDITESIKQFQNGNTFWAQLNITQGEKGDMQVIVYYDYGDGKERVISNADDGTINIVPPSQLRVDYTFGGVDRTATVNLGSTLEINGK